MPTLKNKRATLRRILRCIDDDLLDVEAPRDWQQGLARIRPTALKALGHMERRRPVRIPRPDQEGTLRMLAQVDAFLIRPGVPPRRRGVLLAWRLKLLERLEELDRTGR